MEMFKLSHYFSKNHESTVGQFLQFVVYNWNCSTTAACYINCRITASSAVIVIYSRCSFVAKTFMTN